MQAKKDAVAAERAAELKAAAHGAKDNYAQAKFAKMSNAYDSISRKNGIITDPSQIPNQERFDVGAGNTGYGITNAQTLADMYGQGKGGQGQDPFGRNYHGQDAPV